MRWVHLRINTRVRVLGRLGCTGAFTRRTDSASHDDELMLNVLRCQLTY